MATTSMVPKKCAVLLQMPIKLYATVNLIMEVPLEIHMQQRAKWNRQRGKVVGGI